jgi:MFS family permease
MSASLLAPATRADSTGARTEASPVLGLRENWRQFALLVLVNAFVGAMVGLERSVLPLLGEREFGLASRSAALSFIATFGVVKALTNLLAGRLGDRFGRKHVLVLGWLFALPVPFLIMWAPTWGWIVAANVLLGINQGLAWSMAVVMKIDLVGPKRRGLAMGLNEFAGYLAVALSALATGVVASRYGLRPEPFYLGIAFAAVGLALSVLLVRDTTAHVRADAASRALASSAAEAVGDRAPAPSFRELFARGTWRDPALANASQAGLVNNLNDGLAWGLLPLFFAAAGLSVREIGALAFIYPATWGVAQLATGALSDRWGRKWLIVGGMLMQAAALASMVAWRGLAPWAAAGVALGVGTAMVYPTLLAAIGDVAHPSWRGSAVGVYRLWRDLGYAVGALLAGGLADAFGMATAIGVVAGLTALSGVVVALRMPETHCPAAIPLRVDSVAGGQQATPQRYARAGTRTRTP